MHQRITLCTSHTRRVRAVLVVGIIVNVLWILFGILFLESTTFIYWLYFLGMTNLIIFLATIKRYFFPDEQICLVYADNKIDLIVKNEPMEIKDVHFTLSTIPLTEFMICTSNYFGIKLYYPKYIFHQDEYRNFKNAIENMKKSGTIEFPTSKENPVSKELNRIKSSLKNGDPLTWAAFLIILVCMIATALLRGGVIHL